MTKQSTERMKTKKRVEIGEEKSIDMFHAITWER